jgi:catechol 2,3-dioxygenase-like lactoylglutathione lyase family enzyme
MVDLVKLHHVSFAIKDLDASKSFFGGILGLSELERPGFGFLGAWYALGDRQLHLIQEPANAPDGPERLTRADHMALEVRDVEAVKKTLTDNGIEYQDGGNSSLGMDQVFCRDPDGHVIEFVYYRDS